ncbi:MAG: phosphodiesterase [Oscillospiraceae bacterium]
MKLMIASDIHGSEYYCKKMIEAYEIHKPDKLLLLGDLLYHGPRNALPDGYNPKGVISLLNSLKEKIICVRGNCDSEVDQMVLDFPIMAEYALLYIDGKAIFATHGHLYNNNNLPSLNHGDILLNGHTHIPMIEDKESYTYINPGSVSIPKNGSEHSYLIMENGEFTFCSLK